MVLDLPGSTLQIDLRTKQQGIGHFHLAKLIWCLKGIVEVHSNILGGTVLSLYEERSGVLDFGTVVGQVRR